MSTSLKRKDLRSIHDWLAVGFGSGLAPKAPGTFGTLAALPLVCLMMLLDPIWQASLILLGFIYGCYCCERLTKQLKVHDHGGIVWDEFIGFAITCFALPLSWFTVLIAFILFRLFDVIKPWPIKWFDRKVHGGFGIMLDDVLAGVMAAVLMHFIIGTI